MVSTSEGPSQLTSRGVYPSRPPPPPSPPFFPQKLLILLRSGVSPPHCPTPTPSHSPVPSACWERVWVSLPLMLRVPNKASRRSNCFSFLNRVVLLNSHFQSRDRGLEVRGFRPSSSEGRAYLARQPLGGQGRTEGQRLPHLPPKASDVVIIPPAHLGT